MAGPLGAVEGIGSEGSHLALGMPSVGCEASFSHWGAHRACPVPDGNRAKPRAMQDPKVPRQTPYTLAPQGTEALLDGAAHQHERGAVSGELRSVSMERARAAATDAMKTL